MDAHKMDETGLKMKYARIPYVRQEVSRIFYGTASPPFSTSGEGKELLDAILELGINAFDTARVYGNAETALGRWMDERGVREQVIILSKCGHPDTDWTKRISETEIRSDFAQSSACLRTGYIDIYLAHRDDADVPAGDVVEIFNAMHAEGKIGAFGGSNWTHERIEEANEYAYKHDMIPFTVSSPNFGLAEQVQDMWGGGGIGISGPSHQAARNWYKKQHMPVIAYSSLGRGLFSGRVKSEKPEAASEVMDEFAMKGYAYPDNFERLRRCEKVAERLGVSVPQIAMAWLFSQKLNTFAVVSTGKPKRMVENIKAMHLELDEKTLGYLDLQEESDK